MFGEKIYPAPGGNLMNPVVPKNMGGKMTEFMLKWVPTPNNLEEGGTLSTPPEPLFFFTFSQAM